jgi:hypothetical protein
MRRYPMHAQRIIFQMPGLTTISWADVAFCKIALPIFVSLSHLAISNTYRRHIRLKPILVASITCKYHEQMLSIARIVGY